jgi:hypothetical protein
MSEPLTEIYPLYIKEETKNVLGYKITYSMINFENNRYVCSSVCIDRKNNIELIEHDYGYMNYNHYYNNCRSTKEEFTKALDNVQEFLNNLSNKSKGIK